jgi:hypothetical protein
MSEFLASRSLLCAQERISTTSTSAGPEIYMKRELAGYSQLLTHIVATAACARETRRRINAFRRPVCPPMERDAVLLPRK